MRHFTIAASAALTATFALNHAASANTISFNFGSNLAPTDLAGAPGVRTGNYNSQTAAGTLSTIKDNTGTVISGLSESFAASGNFGFGGGGGTNDALMFSGRTDQGPGSSTVTVTGIPYATYDVYFYMHNDTDAGENPTPPATPNYRTGEFSIGSANRFAGAQAVPDPDSSGNGYVISNDTTQTNAGGTNEPTAVNTTAGNYVVFTGLSGSTLTASITAGATTEGAPRNKAVGFQIVETPEPTSLSLLALGVTPLLARRRRR